MIQIFPIIFHNWKFFLDYGSFKAVFTLQLKARFIVPFTDSTSIQSEKKIRILSNTSSQITKKKLLLFSAVREINLFRNLKNSPNVKRPDWLIKENHCDGTSGSKLFIRKAVARCEKAFQKKSLK